MRADCDRYARCSTSDQAIATTEIPRKIAAATSRAVSQVPTTAELSAQIARMSANNRITQVAPNTSRRRNPITTCQMRHPAAHPMNRVATSIRITRERLGQRLLRPGT